MSQPPVLESWHIGVKGQCVQWQPADDPVLVLDKEKPALLAVGSYEHQPASVSIWGYAHGSTERRAPFRVATAEQPDWVTALRWASSSQLVAACADGSMSLIGADATSLSIRRQWPKRASSRAITDIDCARGEIVSVCEGGTVAFMGLEAERPHVVIPNADGAALNAVRFLRSGEAVTASSSCHLRVFDGRSAAAATSPTKSMRHIGDGAGLTCLAVHPDQPTLIATGASDGSLLMWDLRHDQWPFHKCRSHKAAVSAVQFHPLHPDTLYTASNDGTLLWWAEVSHSLRSVVAARAPGAVSSTAMELFSHTSALNGIDYHPQLRILVAASDAEALLFYS